MSDFGPATLFMILGVRAGSEDEVSAWHAEEHIIERLGVPGFRRGRKGISLDAPQEHRFLVIYEAGAPDVFESPAYLACLNNPTPWTRAMSETHIVGLRRTVCEVVTSEGVGIGGWCGVVMLKERPADLSVELREALKRRGVTGGHVLAGTDLGQQPTVEKRARGGDDGTFAGAVFFEGNDEGPVRAVTRDFAERLGTDMAAVYRIQHVLSSSS